MVSDQAMGVFFLSFGCGRALFVGKTEWFWWMAFFVLALSTLGGKKQRNAKPAGKPEIFNMDPHLNLVNPYLELVIVLNELE